MSPLMLLATLSSAQADVPPEVVQQRIDEIAAMRGLRRDKGAPPISADDYRKAAEGKVVTGLVNVDGHKAKKAWGVAVLDVPIGRYWAAINDDPKKVEYTKLGFAEVLEGGVCKAPRRVFQFLPVPMLTDRWWVVDIHDNPGLHAKTGGRVREQTWATDGTFETPTPATQAWAEKGMHIERTQGSWFLVDLDGEHTLVEYYTWADPGGAIPAGLASSFAAGGIDDTLTVMADLAKAGGTCGVVAPE